MVTDPYVEAVGGFLEDLNQAPDVVDLGCGDFSVGFRLRARAGIFIACDVVPALIERNKARFSDQSVDFRIVDLTQDSLPPARVALIRQVLQHLSNDSILRVLRKIHQYEYSIVTEEIPLGDFTPNLDKATGATIRGALGSGVDVTKAPFNLKFQDQRVLCSIATPEGHVVTTVYTWARLADGSH